MPIEQPGSAAQPFGPSDLRYGRHNLVISTEEMQKLLLQDSAGLRVVDCCPSPFISRCRARLSATGHIPGAVLLGNNSLLTRSNGVPHMLVSPRKAADVLSRAGIGLEQQVVIYDSGSGKWASRLFWTLEYLGHSNVKILDGGLRKWVHEKRSTSRSTHRPPRAEFNPTPRPHLTAAKSWLNSKLDDPTVVLLDTRRRSEYSGAEKLARRAGHIPGAVHVDWVRNYENSDQVGTFMNSRRLEELHVLHGVTRDKEIVTYCQRGIRACASFFVLRMLGYPRVRVYDGSWIEWGNDRETPVVTGSSPG